jgi:PIN domain nuclease of toxin-antitoxin system
MVYLDTHVAVWLVSGDVDLLTTAAKEAIENNDLLISPMVFLEFQFLREQGKIVIEPDELLSILTTDFAVGMCTCPFRNISREAIGLGWTRDPFDRIIVANAAATDSRLITKDRLIRQHFRGGIW